MLISSTLYLKDISYQEGPLKKIFTFRKRRQKKWRYRGRFTCQALLSMWRWTRVKWHAWRGNLPWWEEGVKFHLNGTKLQLQTATLEVWHIKYSPSLIQWLPHLASNRPFSDSHAQWFLRSHTYTMQSFTMTHKGLPSAGNRSRVPQGKRRRSAQRLGEGEKGGGGISVVVI